MSKHILVPLDGSSNAENAVPYAGKLARTLALPLRFIHVADEGEGLDDRSKASEWFAEYVAGLVERFRLSDLQFTTLWLRGAPAPRILDEAERASFIVLASHGRGGFRATFVGSVADKVVRGATTPVLVVPGVGQPAEPEFSPVVVPLDGSDEAEAALAMARCLTLTDGGQVILLRAYGLPRLRGSDFEYYPADMPDVLEAGARGYLDRVADEADEKVVVQAAPAAAICSLADQYDARLVVMAASGKGLAGRLALGSTTDRVMHSLHRPLLIVPARAGE